MLATVLGATGILLADGNDAAAAPNRVLVAVTLVSYVLAAVSIGVLLGTRFWRPGPDALLGGTPWRLPTLVGAALFGMFIVAGGVGATIASAVAPPDSDPLARAAILTWGGLLGGGSVCLVGGILWSGYPTPADARTPTRLGPSIAGAVVLLLLVVPIVQTVSALGQLLQTAISGEQPSPLGHETLRLMVDSMGTPGWWAMTAAAAIGAPIVEEIAYRGFVQQSARRAGVGPVMAPVLVGGIFALVHIPALPEDSRIAGLSGLLVLGIALGILRERTGRLLPCILAHMGFNAFNLIIASSAG